MIKKVYIIGGGFCHEIINKGFSMLEFNFLSGNIKNCTYELMITKGFIDKYGKENVKNCRVRGEGEYKNVFRYRGYSGKHFKLFRELWRNRKDSIIMFHGIYPWILIYALIPAKHKCMWRHTIIGPYNRNENKLKWIILWLIQKFCGSFIDTIFYVNENERKELIKYKYKGNKFFLPIPINTEFWRGSNKKQDDNKSVIHLISTGSICKRKNQSVILDAINLIVKDNSDLNFKIDFPGYDLDLKYKSSLKENYKNLNVNFIGLKTAEELKEIYKKTDIYVQASFSEGLCQTYIEACLCGCPLILSDIPTFTDTAKDCALFFNPLNAKDLADKILYMVEHIDEYREKSRKLAKEFEKFGYESFYKQLNEFISTKVK